MGEPKQAWGPPPSYMDVEMDALASQLELTYACP